LLLLFFSHIHPPAVDGGSAIVWNLRNYFESRGHSVLSLATNLTSTDDFVKPQPPTNSTNLPKLFLLPIYRLHHRLPKPIFKIPPFLKFLIVSTKFHPDYIIAGPLPTTILFYSLIIRFFTQILSRHKTQLLFIPCYHPTDSAFSTPLIHFLLSKTDFIATLTDSETNCLTKLLPKSKTNIFTLGAGVDSSLLIDSKTITFPQTPHFLFLGNFAAHKGMDTLLSSFPRLSSPLPKLTIAGQPTLDYPRIQKLYHSLAPEIKRQITFIPKKYNQARLIKLLDASTALVLPSRHESFGLVLAEAWARGKPVIVSDLPSTHQLIAKTKGGILFETGNITQLSETLKLFVANPKFGKTMGLNGYKYTKKYLTWDRIGKWLGSKLSSSLQ